MGLPCCRDIAVLYKPWYCRVLAVYINMAVILPCCTRFPVVCPGTIPWNACCTSRVNVCALGGYVFDRFVLHSWASCSARLTFCVSHRQDTPYAVPEGSTRLVDGAADSDGQWVYGRLEILYKGSWSNICNKGGFAPNAVQVACRALGFDGGAQLRFTPAYSVLSSTVRFVLPTSIWLHGLSFPSSIGTFLTMPGCLPYVGAQLGEIAS